MFGFGKKDNPVVVGAKQKMLRAKKMNLGVLEQDILSRKNADQKGLIAAVGVVYVLCVALAAVLTDGALMKGAGLHFFTSQPHWDKVLFGPGIPEVYGGEDINKIIVVLLRATAIFAVAGFLPFISRIWNSFRDNPHVNLYVSFWGTTVAVPLVYFLFKDFFWPLLLSFAGAG